MVLAAIVSLFLGIVCGRWIISPQVVALFAQLSPYVLYLLMFAVGISVGTNKLVFQKVGEYHLKILLIPFGVITGSILGGMIASLLLSYPLGEGTAIACGMGWYSLAGVLLTDLSSAQAGSLAFLANLMREIVSFALIPPIAKHLNHFTAIAPAGATSEDTTLPMLIRHTSEEVVVLSVFNGVLCSAAVPIAIDLCWRLLPH